MFLKNRSILITNDDGYKAKGLSVLREIGNHFSKKIYIVAPSRNQSGKSHSISINKKIQIKKYDRRFYHLSGSPVDCVIAGMNLVMPNKTKPDLILSGINDGQNMGRDIFYSGTVGGAREGCLNGILSIALSIEKNNMKTNWNIIYKYAPDILKKILYSKKVNNTYFNINFPNVDVSKVRGYKLVNLGKRKPGLIIRKENKNTIYIPSERKVMKNVKQGEDEYELGKGYITLSLHKILADEKDKLAFKKYKIFLRKLIEK